MGKFHLIAGACAVAILSSCTTGPKLASTKNSCEALPYKVKWKAGEDKPDASGILRKTTGYKLYVKSTKEKAYTSFVDVGNVTEFAVDHLIKGQAYDFRVVAYSEAGDSKPSGAIRRKICK